MLDIKFIRENPALVNRAAKDKGMKVDIDLLFKVDDKRRELLGKVENLRTRQNEISNKTAGKPSKEQILESKELKRAIDEIGPKLTEVENEYESLMLMVPNIPTKDTPIGKDESENKEIKKVGTPKKFSFKPRDHAELGKLTDTIDVERGVKIGGTRSYILKGDLVILEQAVLRYALDLVKKEGFEVMNVPVIVREPVLVGAGFFPFGQDDIYKVNEDDEYLVGTSEASLVYYHSGETLAENTLPRLLSGITTCFRKEVGTYGKDTKGVIRVHQFNKVEQVILCREKDWEKMFDFILNISQEIVRSLGLTYRLVQMCTGDLSAKNAKQVDIEVWFPSQEKYRETHSCSYLRDFQARRSNIKYRDNDGNKFFVHTLNNTAIATPRFLAALMENYQKKDGSIEIPESLVKYTGFKEIKVK